MDEYLTMRVRNIKGAHAKPATVIPRTARYDEICGGAGPSVTGALVKYSYYGSIITRYSSYNYKSDR